ncbi:MAG: peptide deformylase [Longimicrobiales bacterium]
MAKLEVRILGDPILRARAAEVTVVTPELRQLIDDMFETMYTEEGVGLAAPQVGVPQRIIVIDPHENGVPGFALINPVILESSRQVERGEEGCLSIPGIKDIVERSFSVVAEGQLVDGTMRRLEADGLLARILQHEVDHLNGVLFIDRLSPLKRKLVLAKWQKVKPGV